MNKNDALELLKNVTVKDKQIEVDLGLPASTISHIRNLKRDLPKKFDESFLQYCNGNYTPLTKIEISEKSVDIEKVILKSKKPLKLDKDDVPKFDTTLDYDTITFANEKFRLRITPELVKELVAKYCPNDSKSLLATEQKDNLTTSGYEMYKKRIDDAESLVELHDIRKLIGNDTTTININEFDRLILYYNNSYKMFGENLAMKYVKEYSDCEYDEERKVIWDKMINDQNIRSIDKKRWLQSKTIY